MSALNLREAKKVGFNDEIPSLRLHVQTEVLSRHGLVVRTTVLAAGIVRHAVTHPVPAEINDMPELEAFVRRQHQRCVEHINRAGESWLESI